MIRTTKICQLLRIRFDKIQFNYSKFRYILLGWSTLDHIQTECNQALALWNYRKINKKLNKKKLLDEAANTKKKLFLKNLEKRKSG